MYMLAKFQLRILKAFEVTALQSSSNRKIDLYSKHRENKPKVLPKMDVTYEWSKVGTQILHYHLYHELRNGLLGKLFFLLPCITTKSKSMKKHQSRTTALTSREQTTITYHNLQFLGCTATKSFELLLLGQIRWYPGFNHWPLPSLRTRRVKKLMDFFQKKCNYLPNVFQYWKIYYVRFSQIRSHIDMKVVLY